MSNYANRAALALANVELATCDADRAVWRSVAKAWTALDAPGRALSARGAQLDAQHAAAAIEAAAARAAAVDAPGLGIMSQMDHEIMSEKARAPVAPVYADARVDIQRETAHAHINLIMVDRLYLPPLATAPIFQEHRT